MHEFVPNSVFSPKLARFVIFPLVKPFFSDFKQTAPLCTKQRFQPKISTFGHFRTWTPLFNGLQQSARFFYRTQVFSPRSAHFGIFSLNAPFSVIFASGTPLLSGFRQSARVCTKQKFSARNHYVLSFSHLVHHFLTVFSKVHEFVQNREFSPTSARFVISALGEPLFSHS